MEKIIQVKEMVKKLFALKNKTPDKFVVSTWCEVLKNYEIKQLAKAFNAVLKKDGFFEIKMILDELESSNKEAAVIEWDKVVRVAKDGGQGYDNLNQNTKLALKSAGGLNKLRFTESEYTLNEMRKIFIETFDIHKRNDYRQLVNDNSTNIMNQLGFK